MNTIKIALGLPAYRGRIASQHAATWFSLGKYLGAMSNSSEPLFESSIITVDCNGVDRARNNLLAHAMSTGHEWLLMLDDDTWIEGDDPGGALFSMMWDGLHTQKAAVVGAAVRRRGAEGLNVYRKTDGRYSSINLGKIGVALASARHIDVDAIGAACMAINLQLLGDAVFQFTDTHSEDLEFCRQIKEAGGKILVDTNVKTAHLGNAPVLRY